MLRVDASRPQSLQPTNVRWLIFALACGTSWLLYVHRYTYNFIKPELARDYGYSEAQLGALFSLFYYTYGLVQVPAGALCDATGARRLLAAIIALWSLTLAATGLTGSYSALATLRLMFGGAQAGAYPALARVSREWFPFPQRTMLQGLVATTAGRLGGAMSSIVMVTLLMGLCGLTWRMALVAMMLMGLTLAVIVLLAFRDTPADDSRVNDAERELITAGQLALPPPRRMLPLRSAFQNRSLLMLATLQTLSAGADVIYVSLMGSLFLDQYHTKLGSAGLLASLPLVGGALGGFAGGVLNDRMIRRLGLRWGRTCVGLTGPLIGAALMFAVIRQQTALAAGIALLFVKFFVDWSQPTVWGAASDLGGRFTATTFSLVNTGGTVGAALCPIAFGVILDWNTTTETIAGEVVKRTDYGPLLAVIAAIYLLSALCWLGIDCRQKLEPEPPA